MAAVRVVIEVPRSADETLHPGSGHPVSGRHSEGHLRNRMTSWALASVFDKAPRFKASSQDLPP